MSDAQRDFAAALLDPRHPMPPGLVGPDGRPSERRFAVYRNNVITSLCEALGAAFPVVRRLVGDEFFAAIARVHAAIEPPRNPMMLGYGEGFAAFVGRFEPAAVLPYLHDVARLERAWLEAYHAAEATPLAPAALAAVHPDLVPGLRFEFHPSARLVRSAFPVATIWRRNVEDAEPAAIDLDAGGEDAFVVRPAATVEVRCLPPGAAAFIQSLMAGTGVAEAAATGFSDDAGFDLAGILTGLLSAGAIIAWAGPDCPVPQNCERAA